MVYGFGILFFLLAIYGIVKAVTANAYGEMREEELETEAKRASPIGSAVMSVGKLVDELQHSRLTER